MKIRASALLAGAFLAAIWVTPAMAQNTSTIRTRASLSVASSANMKRIAPHKMGLSRSDKKFVHDIAMVHMAEIEMGKLAQRNGGDWGRQYGRDMVREHTIALEELKQRFKGRNVMMPKGVDAKHQRLHMKLSRLHGQSFDNMYRQEMIKGHGEVLAKLHREMTSGRDASVREYAVMMEPSVKMHRRAAQLRVSLLPNKMG